MKKFTSLFIIVLLISNITPVIAQVAPGKYFIQFTDKNNNSFDVSNPSEFLSARSISRREKQNIEITEQDLPVSNYYCDSLTQLGLHIVYKLKWLNGVVIFSHNSSLIDTLDRISFVESVSFYDTKKSVRTIKDKFSNISVNENTSSYNEQITSLNGDYLHNNGYMGEGIIIAILDAGFFNADKIPALENTRNENRILGTKDFVNPGGNVYNEHPHGVRVLSTITGEITDELIGAATDASFWLIRTEDSNSEYIIEEYNWIAGAEFADSIGADITNTSLGYNRFNNPAQDHIYDDLTGNKTVITKGVNIASSKGILTVTSAGNEGNDPWYHISAPADATEGLVVGAITYNLDHANFSSYGPSADGRIKPDVVAIGQGTYLSSEYGYIVQANGTSYSAPIISGMAACLWQALPELTVAELKDRIIKSSSQYQTPDNAIGYGIPDFQLAYTNASDNKNTNPNKIQLYPTLFSDELTIQLNSSINETVVIQFISVDGSLVHQLKKELIDGYARIDELDVLKPGIYVVKILSSKNDYQLKVVKAD